MKLTEPRGEALRQLFEVELTALANARYGAANPSAVSVASHEAARYVLTAGGKRVRPVLCLLSVEALGGEARAAMPAALALEMVHTYSLVHDDLPCMDDDSLRRGKPTAHVVYGEASALLAGDTLLTDAFAVLATAKELPPAARASMVGELALAAGGGGMVLGQSLDLYWTGRDGAGRRELDEIHLKKTGALLGAAAAMGAIAAGANPAAVAGFRAFGERLGLAFQILDDLLDDSAATGKSPGKDKAAGKLTYLTMMSRDAARRAADEATAAATTSLLGTGATTSGLNAFVEALLSRTH